MNYSIWCSMRIKKEEADTDYQMDVMWRNDGTTCFFRKLSTILKDKAGLQMGMENTTGADKSARESASKKKSEKVFFLDCFGFKYNL